MNKYYFLLLLLAWSINLAAQESDKAFQWGLSAQVDVNWQSMDSPTPLFEGRTGFNSQLGLALLYAINRRFKIASGLRVQHLAIYQRDYTTTFACDYNIATGMTDPQSSYIQIVLNPLYLSVPIALQYRVGKSARQYLKLGLAPMIRIANWENSSIFECGEDTGADALIGGPSYESFLMMASLGIGFDFELLGRALFLEPSFSMTLGPVYRTIFDNNFRLWNAALAFGSYF
ncbi:MAG: outer membrane beta-barrel protein [Bacteroidota bacterium]